MNTEVSRRELLWGAGGAALGLGLGIHGSPPVEPQQGSVSYAQSGEDLIAAYILARLRDKDAPWTYLDIGAHKPVTSNNTYYFYERGLRGVLVEPNVALAGSLRSVRPGDTTLVAGIGPTAKGEADYYLMSKSAWNTFSQEEAEHMEKTTEGGVFIKEVVKMPLLDVNDVIAEHFKGAPSFLSIDAEGLHLRILKAIDYDRFRPRVICVETLVSGTAGTIPEIPAFMESIGYAMRGMTFVNSIFVDGNLFPDLV